MYEKAIADAILAGLPAHDESRAYFVDMWRGALGERKTGRGLQKQPFPYVPISPEDLGLDLTAESTLLDVGCLSGYGIFDFHTRRTGAGRPVPRLVGLDIDPVSVELGRALARIWADDTRVTFCLASCESIPHEPGAFDMLIARTVLPYVNIDATLSEFARVLRPSGLALIQLHAPGYYWWHLARSLRQPLLAGYYARPLVSRVILGLTGRQPEHRWFQETALHADELIALCRRHDLTPVWSQPHRYHPIVTFRRGARPYRPVSAARQKSGHG